MMDDLAMWSQWIARAREVIPWQLAMLMAGGSFLGAVLPWLPWKRGWDRLHAATIQKASEWWSAKRRSETFPSISIASFDYSNNDGEYRLGHGEQMFKNRWGRCGESNLYLYKDPASLGAIAVTDKQAVGEIGDARVYDGSSNARTLRIGEVAVLRNPHGFWAAVKIMNIENRNRGSDHDELTFEYVIQTNGTPSFTGVTPPTPDR